MCATVFRSPRKPERSTVWHAWGEAPMESLLA